MSTVYTYVDSPVGSLFVLADDEAVIRVAFEREDFETVLSEYPQATRDDNAPLLAKARTQLSDYFAGRCQSFDLPAAQSESSEFRRNVLAAIAEIPYGATITYAELATRAGNPDAVRAAGTACGSNPLPLIVPCHRVVRSDGSPGSYLGGSDAKEWLLAHERQEK